MTISKRTFLSVALALGLCAAVPVSPVNAGDTDPLFINLTSDEGHRITMAFRFGRSQHGKGHPLTIFLNDRAVFAASKSNAQKYADQHKTIADLAASGVTFLICGMCMEHYGMSESDLIPDVKLGNPELIGAALFADDTKTLTW